MALFVFLSTHYFTFELIFIRVTQTERTSNPRLTCRNGFSGHPESNKGMTSFVWELLHAQHENIHSKIFEFGVYFIRFSAPAKVVRSRSEGHKRTTWWRTTMIPHSSVLNLNGSESGKNSLIVTRDCKHRSQHVHSKICSLQAFLALRFETKWNILETKDSKEKIWVNLILFCFYY